MVKEYLRPDEVAEKMNVSKRTVYNLMKDVENPLPSVKILGNIRIKASDLELYIKKNKNKSWE